MSFLDDVLGSVLGSPERRQQMQDFVRRYQEGEPQDHISGQEAFDRYNEVARRLPEDDYVSAAQGAFERMSPEQRQQFYEYLQQRAQAQNVDLGRIGGVQPERVRDPGELARVTSRLEHDQPGLLEQLLGGGRGGGDVGDLINHPLAKAALAGIAAMAAQRFLGGAAGQQRPHPREDLPSGHIL